jgi:hypothetical protein
MRIKFNTRKFDRELERHVNNGIHRATIFFQAEVKDSLSIGQRIEVRTAKRGKNKGKTYKVGLDPSTPPDPPHVLYGDLRRKIHRLVQRGHRGISGYVGTNVEYARRLELGYHDKGVSQAPRPYLRKVIWEQAPKIFKLIAKG